MILLPREAGAHSRRGEAVGAGAAKAPEEEAAFDRTHGGRAGEARSNAKGAVNRKSAFEDHRYSIWAIGLAEKAARPQNITPWFQCRP